MIYSGKKALIEHVVTKNDVVLDVGFFGHGITTEHENWPHRFIKCRELFGIDIVFDDMLFPDTKHYSHQSAEGFSLPTKFDVILALDLIEHLPNPGLFLTACRNHLKPGGKVIISTPNCFNLFNLTEKITKTEPTVNGDHTCYFNSRTLKTLAKKSGLELKHIDYIYSLGSHFKESWKKKCLNVLYKVLSTFTHKYMETIVVTLGL